MNAARAVFAGILVAAAGFSQTPASVNVLSDEQQVLVGGSVKMKAVVRDASGTTINSPVTWSVNRPADATIAADGTLTARGLATVRVTARAGSATAEAAIQTIPSRVEVQPSAAEIEVGSGQQFRAVAFDLSGNPINGVTFSWSALNQRQGTSSLGTISTSGMFRATGEGGIWVWAVYNYNEAFPGQQRQWVAYANVKATVPRMYELRRLHSTMRQQRRVWPLRARQSMLWSSDDGSLYFNASLGGLANGLLHWKQDRFTLLAAGGVPSFGRSATTLDFRNHSISRSGRILSYEDTNINGAEINRGSVETGLAPYVNNNVPLGPVEATSGLFITRNSHTSTNASIVRANFRFENVTTTFTGLFRSLRDPVWENLINTRETLPEIAAGFTIDADFGIASNGTAVYSVTNGASRVFYIHAFEGRRKLIAVGDPVLNSRVRTFTAGRGNSPSFWLDEDGTALVCVTLEDGSLHYLSFGIDGRMRSLRLSSQAGILYRHPDHGTLIYANPFNNRGNGVYLWKDDAAAEPAQVYGFGRRLFNQTIQEVESGTIDRGGNVTLILRGDTNPLLVARMAAEPQLLFSAGAQIEVEAPVNVFTLIGGARTGPPHIQAGGNAGSIAEFNGGDWQLTLGIGERLFGTTMWFGGSHGATYNIRKAPNGDVYLITGAGIARIEDGAPKLVLAFPLRLDSLTVNNPGQFDVNGNGALLFHSSTSSGDNRFFIHENGQTRQILVLSPTAATASAIENRTVQSFDSFAFDDLGRVIAQIRFRGGATSSMCIWDGSSWILAAQPGLTRVAQHLIINVPNVARAAGSRLFSGLTIANGAVILAEWSGGAFQAVINNDTMMPNGQVANNAFALDLNRSGDMLFQYGNVVNRMVVRRGDRMYQVHNFLGPTPEGDYLVRINAMDLRDDGTVYFLAVTSDDEVVLYQASPLF
jgi:hypothetical protein